jgi:hypothetical protein
LGEVGALIRVILPAKSREDDNETRQFSVIEWATSPF